MKHLIHHTVEELKASWYWLDRMLGWGIRRMHCLLFGHGAELRVVKSTGTFQRYLGTSMQCPCCGKVFYQTRKEV